MMIEDFVEVYRASFSILVVMFECVVELREWVLDRTVFVD
jgi:hypothetical protein